MHGYMGKKRETPERADGAGMKVIFRRYRCISRKRQRSVDLRVGLARESGAAFENDGAHAG
jgi:hypothetical protein